MPEQVNDDEILSRPDVREAEFRVLFDHALSGVAYVAADGTFLRVNDQFARLVGYSPKELERRRRWQDITHPDDLEVCEEESDAVVKGEKVEYRTNKRYLHKRGYVVHCEVLVTSVLTKDKVFAHFVKQANEIRLSDRHVSVTKDADGNAVLRPFVPVREFLASNWKVVATVLTGFFTSMGVAVNSYYETKAKAAAQEVEIQRLQERLDRLKTK